MLDLAENGLLRLLHLNHLLLLERRSLGEVAHEIRPGNEAICVGIQLLEQVYDRERKPVQQLLSLQEVLGDEGANRTRERVQVNHVARKEYTDVVQVLRVYHTNQVSCSLNCHFAEVEWVCILIDCNI